MTLLKKHLWISVLPLIVTLTGCQLTEEDREKVTQLADQIIITYPANEATVVDSMITVRSDIPASADAQEVTLYVDGVEVAKDSDGAPWEISWPAYYWADGEKHTLLLKTLTGTGVEVRNNQQYQVTVSTDANKALSFGAGLDGTSVKDINSIEVEFSEFPGATSYEVLYSAGGKSNKIELDGTSVVLADLDVGEYSVRYRALKKFSDLTEFVGAWSSEIMLVVRPPDLPVINDPEISYENESYNIDISWSEIDVESQYVAFFKKSDEAEFTQYQLGHTDAFSLSGLSAGAYEFELRRINSLGHESSSSSTIEVNAGVYFKRFGGSGDEIAKHVQTTNAGEYIVLASTTSKGDPQGDDWVFLLDMQGNIVWEYYYTDTGGPVMNEVLPLDNGNFVLYGAEGTYPYYKGFIGMLGPQGQALWMKKYTNSDYDSLNVIGVAEVNGALYAALEGMLCVPEGSGVSCQREPPLLETIDLETGEITSSLEIGSLDGAQWNYLSSFGKTSSGKFLLGASVKKDNCTDIFFGCYGAGIAIVNILGEIESDWHSLESNTFGYGRYAAESPVGGFVLAGGPVEPGGTLLASFSSNADYLGTYSYSGAYSNQKEYLAFNKVGKVYQLVEKFSSDRPVLVSMDLNGNYREEKVFTELKSDYSSPAALDSTVDEGLVLLFTERQSSGSNNDIVIMKIGNLE